MRTNSLDYIKEKALDRRRISPDEALLLMEGADLTLLGFLANEIRKNLHPEDIVTFVIDRNVNYTNICVAGCKFCAFQRKVGSPEGYVLSKEEILRKVQELVDWGGTTLLMQGGLNPDLPLEYYEDLISSIKERFPQIQVHSFSAPEIVYLSKLEGISIKQVLERLKNAGLDSLPGGGAEVLSQEVRSFLSPGKCTVEQWEEVHRTAHELGMTSTATMMFGHIEKPHHIVEHLERVRRLQDETGGFTAFIPWTFKKGNTQLDHIEETSTVYYLKVLALSRIYLDNFKNIQSSHVTQTMHVGMVGLHFGANDMGSVMIEENVISSTSYKVNIPKVEDMVSAIRSAGFVPAQRDTYYRIVRVFE
ncbi:cyclic dehypoxanthinyl futalosine synthase [Hydrogenobacter hydrogenophilus]|uniref:Cyclic dehypoxanthine futalosine synthase n=1 Tax=Hydrogenobacter hydrogenophilus TaxID=35835 RepID=A0A285P194_9AQUI|nr:cyclic dehypoxanthinyl futalosine synthase [Hydrogenobacter hydrogenophilus]SNZ13926.1 de-hypoxanthine futalosine cyclase [Hydrogenobacter hydrogenophilus]